jgi:Zn-dependent metalloprotease
MLRAIAEKGTRDQRQAALHTLRMTSQFQNQRVAIPKVASAQSTLSTRAIGPQRTVYDAQCGSNLPGIVVRQEGGPRVADPAVNEAYDGAGSTYDLFWLVYGRNSIDNRGMKINSSVHYQKGYDNAFWNGFQMVYGDGDEDLPLGERLFNRFTICPDVIAHELSHGVIQFEAALVYQGQSGALNESFADVFGTLTKQRQLGQSVAQADWIVGKGLFTTNVRGVGVRSLCAPGTAYDDPVLGKDPQPGHMNGYVNTIEDNGGVHINSGIPNHAFYLAAMEIGGNAWEKTGKIWYVTLADKLSPVANFQEAANQTFWTAGEIFGKGSLEQQAIQKGWNGVGIAVSDAQPSGCLPVVLGMLQQVKR